MRHRILAAAAVAVAATACVGPSGTKADDAKPSAAEDVPTPVSSPTPSLSVPATPSPSPTPTPVEPKLTPVTIDDWRYGYAWRNFSTDINGSGGEYDKPGEVHAR